MIPEHTRPRLAVGQCDAGSFVAVRYIHAVSAEATGPLGDIQRSLTGMSESLEAITDTDPAGESD